MPFTEPPTVPPSSCGSIHAGALPLTAFDTPTVAPAVDRPKVPHHVIGCIFPISPTPACFDQFLIHIRPIREAHAGNGPVELVEAVRVHGDLFPKDQLSRRLLARLP